MSNANTRVNADSMTNAQGEFNPSKPRSEPLQESGHQPGQLVGNDAAPEFHAKTLPAGTAPKESTFQPNPINEIPGQANNPDSESTASAALDMPGATSGDVHTGLGHPGSGQTTQELKKAEKSHSARDGQAVSGQGEGGSGLTGDESAHAQHLQKDHTSGPTSGKEFNVSLDGAESKEHVHAEEAASLGQQVRKGDYDRQAEAPPGSNS